MSTQEIQLLKEHAREQLHQLMMGINLATARIFSPGPVAKGLVAEHVDLDFQCLEVEQVVSQLVRLKFLEQIA